jgi:hypothetical protein
VVLAEASRTHGMQMVFPALKRGLWRFEALPGSSGGSALLGFRTFVVTGLSEVLSSGGTTEPVWVSKPTLQEPLPHRSR